MSEHLEVEGGSVDGDPPRPFGHPSEEGIYTDCPGGKLSQEGICRRDVIGYAGYLKELARKLRNNMTLGEVLL
jgi:hypothetical protein